MNNNLITSSTIVVLVALTIAIAMSPINIGRTEPSYAQPTFDGPSSPTSSPDTGSSTDAGTSDDGETFQQFMDCLFGGEVSEDISNALDGSSDSTPTEQEIRDCFVPLYNTDSATDTTTEAGSGSTDEPEATSDDGGTSDDDGENSADSGTS
jgi:septal ring-binding cell division protein DamX